MRIVADRQIPHVQAVFSGIGDMTMCEGQGITPAIVRDADILLIRSVTRVNADLLHNSRIKFVATATSGVDHVDVAYLRHAGIGFASAPGCNAQAVVEYVLSCMYVLAAEYRFSLAGKTVGIIGDGQVGSRLRKALHVIGVDTVLNDPPLKDMTGDKNYRDLPEVINTDIITLHVPLTDDGRYPTRHLVNDQFLARMQPGTILINTSRGPVIEENALRQYVRQQNGFPMALDVWENEPAIDLELLAASSIGTPHIAGYSMDAKLRATAMIYRATCDYFHLSRDPEPQIEFDDLHTRHLETGDAGISVHDALASVVLTHYDVRNDAVMLRRLLEVGAGQAATYFDTLRKNYPWRREFSGNTVTLPASRSDLVEIFSQLGFSVSFDRGRHV
jgi:Phosphoglycerate dehydrogenase and related dehydrogenases